MPRGKKSEEGQATKGKGRKARRYYCVGNTETEDAAIQEFLTLEDAVSYMMSINEEYKADLESGESVTLPIYIGIIAPFNKPLKISKKVEFDKE